MFFWSRKRSVPGAGNKNYKRLKATQSFTYDPAQKAGRFDDVALLKNASETIIENANKIPISFS
jgi:hypothetical protein